MPDTTETRGLVAQLRAEECVSSDKAANLIERLSRELLEAKEALQTQKATIVLLRSQVRMLGAEPIAEVTGLRSVLSPKKDSDNDA